MEVDELMARIWEGEREGRREEQGGQGGDRMSEMKSDKGKD